MNAYKSWGALKKQMEGLLCDALRGRITYFYTTYHRVHNAYGRASINDRVKELVAFSWAHAQVQDQDIIAQYDKMGWDSLPSAFVDLEGALQAFETANDAAMREKWMPSCTLTECDFLLAVTTYLKTNIADALVSENYLLRIFAYMDRRIGKRSLLKIRDVVETLPTWVRQFYELRCVAEGIEIKEESNRLQQI